MSHKWLEHWTAHRIIKKTNSLCPKHRGMGGLESGKPLTIKTSINCNPIWIWPPGASKSLLDKTNDWLLFVFTISCLTRYLCFIEACLCQLPLDGWTSWIPEDTPWLQIRRLSLQPRNIMMGANNRPFQSFFDYIVSAVLLTMISCNILLSEHGEAATLAVRWAEDFWYGLIASYQEGARIPGLSSVHYSARSTAAAPL